MRLNLNNNIFQQREAAWQSGLRRRIWNLRSLVPPPYLYLDLFSVSGFTSPICNSSWKQNRAVIRITVSVGGTLLFALEVGFQGRVGCPGQLSNFDFTILHWERILKKRDYPDACHERTNGTKTKIRVHGRILTRLPTDIERVTLRDSYNTMQYNTSLTTPHGGFSVTMQLREATIVSKKTKINSKTLYYVWIKIK